MIFANFLTAYILVGMIASLLTSPDRGKIVADILLWPVSVVKNVKSFFKRDA